MAIGPSYRTGMIRGAHRPAVGSTWFGVATLTAAVAALAGALVVHSPPLALVVVGLVVVATYMGETARRPLGEVLIVGMIALCGVVDILQRVDAGAASGQAVETVVVVLLGLLVCLTGITVPAGAAGRALGCVALFVIFTLISFTWGSVSTQGLQNVLVYVAAVLFMAIAATVIHHRGYAAYEIVGRAFWVAAIVGLGLYAISVAIAGPGNDKILSPRPFGLMGVVLVAWFVSGGLIGRRWAYWVVVAAIVLTLLSLSRSALAAEFALVALARLNLRNFRGWIVGIGAGLAILAVALSAVFFYAPLHHRFFHGDTQKVGSFSINVTGRNALWSANWGWFKEKPLIGWGAGASDRMTLALPGRGAGHPHNDYLRILVDYGLIGFVLWMTAYLSLLRLTWKRWQEVRGTRVYAEQIHAAAFLVLVGIGIAMLVDNPLIELARMGPLGIMVGLSLGLPNPRRGTGRPVEQPPAALPVPAAR
jgi:O-antigen ligase